MLEGMRPTIMELWRGVGLDCADTVRVDLVKYVELQVWVRSFGEHSG